MKKRLTKRFAAAFITAILLCTMPIMMRVTRGQPSAPAFWVEPTTENFNTTSATIGTLFNVTVWGAVADDTCGWSVQLGFDTSELQAVAAGYTFGASSELFAGHTTEIVMQAYIDNVAGTVFPGEVLFAPDHVGPAGGSLFWVTFEITAASTQGQSLTSRIDPGYGIASHNTVFLDTNLNEETPLSVAACAYTYSDSAVWSPNPTFVSCSPNPVYANVPVTCTASVSGWFDPTGTVTWSTNSSTGFFSPVVCSLFYGSCSTIYSDASSGTITITASYSGDSNNTPSNGSTILKVNPQPGWSLTFVSCSPNPVYTSMPVTCTAYVSGWFDPTGTVTWSTNSSTGFFSPSISTLSYGYCSTTYSDVGAGTITITASYSGDLNNPPSSGYTTLKVYSLPALPSKVLLNVPYHHQINSYYCGPAALEEVFNYYGPDIPQLEIADVARTSPDGTYTPDMIRAAQFSDLSTSVGRASSLNYTGYTARRLGYAALEYGPMTIEELKSVIAAGYPVIVLTTWHFRVAVGYDDTYIIFQDPYYGSLFEMTYDEFSADWDYSDHWALLVSPWHVDISNPCNVLQGEQFNVTATVTYPWVPPFPTDYPQVTALNATIMLPTGVSLVSGETAQKTIETESLCPGQSFSLTWEVQSQSLGNYRIGVEVEGLVNGFMPPLSSNYPPYTYEDRIGGTNQSVIAVTSSLDGSPPITTQDYDSSWQLHDFTINLTASDDMAGVLETYYRINDGPTESLSLNGQPLIETSKANNTLEYWSIDWAGNEELPHKVLTDIKLDQTKPVINAPMRAPAAEVQPHQPVRVSVNATDSVSGIRNVTLQYTLDNGNTWETEEMALNVSTGLYEATILGQPAGTLVKYRILAFDTAGNNAVRTDYGKDYSYQVQFLQAAVTPDRETLNLGYNGQWLTFCIELPEGYNVGDIDISSLKLNATITADSSLRNIGDYDHNGVQDLTVCFNRTLVSQFILCSNVTTGDVILGFNGRLRDDGSLFESVCALRVRMLGDINVDGKVDMQDVALAAKAFGSSAGQPGWKSILDENEDNHIDLKDIGLVARNFGKTYA